jgi:uncharacterized protein YndB with AHSA1/START domain
MKITKSIIIEASPEIVFNAITLPEELTQWFPDKASKNWRESKIRYC